MKRISAITGILMIFLSVSTLAQTETVRATTRQKAQHGRIYAGRQDGEVTRREAYALNREQRHIRKTKRRAKSDGEVTFAEKARMERKQDRANRHIRRARHNQSEKHN
jgi:hypothetical protein